MAKQVNRRALLAASSLAGMAAVAPRTQAAETTPSNASLVSVEGREPNNDGWLMPMHFGSPVWGGREAYGDPPGEAHYGDVTSISITFRTEADALLRHLPRPYELDGPPTVTIAYSMNRDITWLAGGAYNIVSVTARAAYPCRDGRVTGDYVLVLWENLTEPILAGREFQGMPKIYGDIDDHRVDGDVWSAKLGNRGRTLMELEAKGLQPLGAEALSELQRDSGRASMLGWKYIPNETGTAPVLSYATEYPTSTQFKAAWNAEGRFHWNPQRWKENPTQAHIVNAIHSLPVKEQVGCLVAKSSLVLQVAQVRRLT